MRYTPFLGLVSILALGVAPGLAQAAGPCTSDIAKLRKELAAKPGLGAAVSEPGAGQTVGRKTAQNGMGAGQQNQEASTSGQTSKQASLAHGGSPGTVSGAAGAVGAATGKTTENAVASGQIATSSEDVRRQSVGKPTMAQQAARQAEAGNNDISASGSDMSATDRVSEAKAALQRAVDLNARNDKACQRAVEDARKLMPQQHG